MISSALKLSDPELAGLVEEEQTRQTEGIELIASENFTSPAVLELLGSCLTNKYSEGQPGHRYYGGNEVIDKIEILCKKRALEAFNLDPEIWDVNVQPYSGSPANFAVYTALLQPHDRIMGLGLPSGGHLTHGFYTQKKKISATSIFFESLPYGVSEETGLIDFEDLRKQALLFRPKLIIAGASAYPREIDFGKFREIADEVGCLLMADMAHIAGLVVANLHPSPFEHCDIVTTTTHKTLRGPRSGMIFSNMGRLGKDVKEKIDSAVFPALQGGPHNHQIGALAFQLKEIAKAEWKDYASKVISNSKALAKSLLENDQRLVTGGTDNHLVLWDLRPLGITGSKFEKVAEEVGISLNKNTVPGDKSAFNPSGVRLGSPAMTTRGLDEAQFKAIGVLLMQCGDICKAIQKESGPKLVDFVKGIKEREDVQELKSKVKTFAKKFPYPQKHD